MTEKVDISVQEKEKVKQVFVSYLKWFLGAAVLAILGTIGACFLNAFHPFSGLQIRIFQIFSLVLEAASLGQCGKRASYIA